MYGIHKYNTVLYLFERCNFSENMVHIENELAKNRNFSFTYEIAKFV